ncbi:hypothetical protein [Bordetella flabilis]|uniref:Resolvase HTH domain-containing protein n=1 Tax=Bordetella flabilis TaxID=463014 RepID=A0A193GAD4_9BORD|nr:hypothetical protein [Bordetella flabilis]ANN76795.1 hypothetical protein BAU07_06420 [Bordetella flabilis]
MAGKPKYHEDVAKLRGHLDEWIDMQSEGLPARVIAEKLGVSKSSLWKLAEEDADIGAALSRARTRAAFALVEEASDLIDDAPLVAEALRKADMQAKARFWRAERLNREQFGQRVEGGVTINLNALHLDAVRALSAGRTGALPAAQAVEIPALPAPAEHAGE